MIARKCGPEAQNSILCVNFIVYDNKSAMKFLNKINPTKTFEKLNQDNQKFAEA